MLNKIFENIESNLIAETKFKKQPKGHYIVYDLEKEFGGADLKNLITTNNLTIDIYGENKEELNSLLSIIRKNLNILGLNFDLSEKMFIDAEQIWQVRITTMYKSKIRD